MKVNPSQERLPRVITTHKHCVRPSLVSICPHEQCRFTARDTERTRTSHLDLRIWRRRTACATRCSCCETPPAGLGSHLVQLCSECYAVLLLLNARPYDLNPAPSPLPQYRAEHLQKIQPDTGRAPPLPEGNSSQSDNARCIRATSSPQSSRKCPRGTAFALPECSKSPLRIVFVRT